MGTKLAGKSGQVYVASTIIDDCEDAWNSGTHGTATPETTIVKVGTGSSKCVGLSVVAGDVMMYETIAAGATDYSTFTHALCWARSAEAKNAGDLKLVIDKDTGIPTAPETEMTFPALTVNTWKYCHLTNVTNYEIAKSTAGLVVGLEYHANQADTTIYLDDIRAAKTVLGINTWSLDNVTESLETSDFACAGVKSYIVGSSGWSGSFAGYKDGAPLSMGEIYGIELAESATTAQMWLGNIIITGVHPSASTDGLVLVSYDFQGTGVLTPTTA